MRSVRSGDSAEHSAAQRLARPLDGAAFIYTPSLWECVEIKTVNHPGYASETTVC